MLKRIFFLILVFLLTCSNGFCKMKGLSGKQLQEFVSNESICYEKIVKSCGESDKPEAVQEDNKKMKGKDQLETLEDTLDNMKYSSEVAAPVNDIDNSMLRPPSIVYININSSGQQTTQVVK